MPKVSDSLRYTDSIYGTFEINDGVVLELMQAPSMQRLKGVNNAGYRPIKLHPRAEELEYHSRFDHSMGVYLLLKKHGASLGEQIAGLLHDVSHTAFSHCVDYALSDDSGKRQDFQDRLHGEYIRKSEIPGILKKYGFDLDYILDDSHFPLKETDLPELCADRIDYAFRELVNTGELIPKENHYYVGELSTKQGRWYFKSYQAALGFARLFRKMNELVWCGFASAVMNQSVGNYLRHAMQKGYITLDDLYTTDKIVLERINSHLSSDASLRICWDRMNGRVAVRNDPDAGVEATYIKNRLVDPLFMDNGTLRKISSADKEFADLLRNGMQPRCYFVAFES